MRGKWIYLMTPVLILLISAGAYGIDAGKKTGRVHQHREQEWQPAQTQEEDGEFCTHLPIVNIYTGDQKIPGTVLHENKGYTVYETAEDGEETITVPFTVTDGQEGNNRLSDEPHVRTLAKIRYRGNSSRFFYKKSFSVHLVQEDGSDDSEELAGMTAHNEWVLNGPFLDRTLMRNYLCLNIAGEIMEYAPNVRYCELFIDGEYHGLYLLMEAVSGGNGRLPISKPEKNSAVTGYAVRWDRVGKGDRELDNYARYTMRADVSALDVRYPGRNQITEERMRYVEEDISRMEKVLYSYDLTDKTKGAAQYIDYESFAEYFIINEFFRNVDAGRFSTVYYKDVRGRLKACVWDFNNACDNYIDYTWSESGFTMQNAPYFGALLRDERFVDAVVRKYRQLREGVLGEEYLYAYLDETRAWLGDSVDRNYEKWGYVFDRNNYHGMNYLTPVERNDTDYDGAVLRLKDFISARGKWLDAHIDTLYQYCHPSKNVNELTR